MLLLLIIASVLLAAPVVLGAWRGGRRAFAVTLGALCLAGVLFLLLMLMARTEAGIGFGLIASCFAAITIALALASLAYTSLRRPRRANERNGES